MKNVKIIGSISIMLFHLTICFTQQNLEWAHSDGTVESDEGRDVVFDNAGFNYTLAKMYYNNSRATVTKRAGSGAIQWVRTFGAGSIVYGQAITTDIFGNVYVTGYFNGTSDFNPGGGVYNMTSLGGSDYFVVKLDSNGNFIWARSFGGAGTDDIRSVKADNAGNIILTGQFMNTVDFDPGPGVSSVTSAGSRDIFIQKLNSSGNLVWVKTFGGTGYDNGMRLTIDTNNDIIATGRYQGTVDFDPGVGVSTLTATDNGMDIYIVKLDASGNHIWSKSIGGSGGEVPFNIVSGPSNAIYIAGSFEENMDCDPDTGVYELTSLGTPYDAFIVKLDSSGQYEWAHAFGTVGGYAEAYGIALDNAENVYITGYFNGTIDFDPASVTYFLTSSAIDYFVAKFNINGAFIWAINSGTSGYESALSIAVDSDDNVIIVGAFEGTVDFDPGTSVYQLTAVGQSDCFTMFLSQECSSTGSTPDLASLVNITAQCSVTSLTAPTATNSCGDAITGAHNVTLPITTQGTTVVTWTYDDGNGNTSTQTQNVIISDNTAPVENTANLSDITGQCSVTSLTAPTATDNCTGTIIGMHNATLPITTQGTTVVTWTYDDGNGNTSTQTQNVIIEDNVAPVANTANLSDITGQCSVTSLTSPTATDNCAGIITGTNNATLPITTQGTTVVTWTYDDGNGNTSTQTQNVIIDDNVAPVANTANLSDITGQCSVTSLTSPTATDNCAGIITGTNNATLPITTQGTTVVTWTYNDGNGNTSTQTQNIIITFPVATTTLSGLTITATTSGATYQWIDCGNGNIPISGATSQSYTATINGSYAVIVTQNGCSATSDCVAVNSVGIESLEQNGWSVYPNPTNGVFIVTSTAEFNNSTIEVYSTLGQLLYSSVHSGDKIVIDLHEQPTGMYILKVNNQQIFRIIKL